MMNRNVITEEELQAELESVLARVAAGETLDILRRGHIVAEIGPKVPLGGQSNDLNATGP